jgi:hypothetical protein
MSQNILNNYGVPNKRYVLLQRNIFQTPFICDHIQETSKYRTLFKLMTKSHNISLL